MQLVCKRLKARLINSLSPPRRPPDELDRGGDGGGGRRPPLSDMDTDGDINLLVLEGEDVITADCRRQPAGHTLWRLEPPPVTSWVTVGVGKGLGVNGREG